VVKPLEWNEGCKNTLHLQIDGCTAINHVYHTTIKVTSSTLNLFICEKGHIFVLGG